MNKTVFAIHACLKVLLSGLAAALFLTSCRSDTKYPNTSEPFTFVQLCDPQLGFSGYERDCDSLRQAVRQINTLNPDIVVVCGDMVNNSDAASFADFKIIAGDLKMPYYCVPGNHDVGNQPTAQSLQTYRQTIGKDYFVLEHKGAAFIFINTQLIKEYVPGESEKQDQWLRQSLKESFEKQRQLFIVGHYPLFCQQADEPDEYMNLPRAKRAELLSLFDRYNTAAVLGGHTHTLTLNRYHTIQLVNAESTSRNFDERPLGFRMWYINEQEFPRHEFIPLDMPAP